MKRTVHDRRVESIQILRVSKFHEHFRRDALMRAVAKHIFAHVKYVLAMPNNGPIETIDEALAYHNELAQIARQTTERHIGIIMTLYHSRKITPQVIEYLARSNIVRAVKHYPPVKNITTGSQEGGATIEESGPMFERMQENGVPFLVHCEDAVDTQGRPLDPTQGEAHMIRHRMWRLRDKFPRLRICIEHASTVDAIQFVKADTSGNTVMTVTPHHPAFTNEDFVRFGNDLKCKPIVQTRENRDAIRTFMTSGDRRVIAGDDTAPHIRSTKAMPFKKAANGCWLPHSLALYAKTFDEAGALDERFERFMSINGPTWWHLPLPRADDTVTFYRTDTDDFPEPVLVPELDDVVVPLGWSEHEASRLKIGWAIK